MKLLPHSFVPVATDRSLMRYQTLALLLVLVAAFGGLAIAQPPQQPATVIVASVVNREVAAGQTFVGAVVPSKKIDRQRGRRTCRRAFCE